MDVKSLDGHSSHQLQHKSGTIKYWMLGASNEHFETTPSSTTDKVLWTLSICSSSFMHFRYTKKIIWVTFLSDACGIAAPLSSAHIFTWTDRAPVNQRSQTCLRHLCTSCYFRWLSWFSASWLSNSTRHWQKQIMSLSVIVADAAGDCRDVHAARHCNEPFEVWMLVKMLQMIEKLTFLEAQYLRLVWKQAPKKLADW